MNGPSGPRVEEDQALEGLAAARVTDRGQLRVTGSDRTTFLHNMCTQNINALRAGAGTEAFFTNVQGKILAYAWVFCEEDALVLDLDRDAAPALAAHLDKYLIREDVSIADESEDRAWWILSGRRAGAWFAEQGGEVPPEPMGHAHATVGPLSADVRRVDWTGCESFFLVTPAAEADDWRDLFTNGSVPVVDAGAVEVRRVEQGWPRYGLDIHSDNFPQEVDRDACAVSFTKGCYLGQETVARIDAVGHVNRLLVRLRFPESPQPAVGTVLTIDEKEVGRVSSSVHSPRHGPVALGYVRRAHAAPGTRLAWEDGEAEVVGRATDADS